MAVQLNILGHVDHFRLANLSGKTSCMEAWNTQIMFNCKDKFISTQ